MQRELTRCEVLPDSVSLRTQQLLNQRRAEVYRRTDRLFAQLMLAQWMAAVVVALVISPRAWEGASSQVHLHVWAAIFLGGAICSLPSLLSVIRPGSVLTRHVIASAQMLMSALLIHLSGGRIETHFHIFGSLALLAFYRDWPVLLTAAMVTAADHLLRGVFWPESVYGVAAINPWRWLEHGGWVLFEVCFLALSCRRSQREMSRDAHQRALLEDTQKHIESEVISRTADLERSRRQLQQSEQQVRLLVEAAPCGMIMLNAAGTITLVNAKMEELFGYKRAELLGRPIELLIPQRNDGNHLEMGRSFFDNPETQSMGEGRDLSGVRKDGTEIPLEIGLNPIATLDGPMVLAVIVDVTQRKLAEQRSQQHLRELEIKNRDLDEFTYVASHDLQEPIRKLVSFSTLLKKDLGTDLNEMVQKDLGFIVDAAQRMRNLVQDLLALSRTGRSAIKSDPVGLAECVQRASEALELRIQQTNAEISSDPMPTVIGDRTMLTQLYQNLIGNALKFMAKDRQPVIHLTAERDGDRWVLGVKDNGIGLRPEYADRIFAPFQRLHSRGEYEGTGIGLAICKKSVERHGGTIWVESTPGEGAHFKFTVPVSPETELCPRATSQRSGELSFC